MRKYSLLLVLLGAAAALYWLTLSPPPALKAFAVRFTSSTAPKKARTRPPVAVTSTIAKKQDVPITLSALGTVQAARTVQLRARVDGTLESINFTEGQMVKQGDVLAQIDPRLYKAALDQAKAKLAQDQAQLGSDEKDLERAEQLNERAYASRQSIDQRRAAVEKGKALVASDKAAIDSAETQLAYTRIMAPFSGRIGLRGIDAGNFVRASESAPVATLTQQRPIFVLFSLPEARLGALRKAMQAGTVRVTAYDQETKQPVATGALRVIDSQIDTSTGTMRLKAEFANEDSALWPGQFVPVTVAIAIRQDVVALPNAAIQRGPNGLYVWRVGEDRIARMAPVEAGSEQGDLTIIESGVKPGDRVVVSGQYRLRPGAVIRAEDPKVSARETKDGVKQ